MDERRNITCACLLNYVCQVAKVAILGRYTAERSGSIMSSSTCLGYSTHVTLTVQEMLAAFSKQTTLSHAPLLEVLHPHLLEIIKLYIIIIFDITDELVKRKFNKPAHHVSRQPRKDKLPVHCQYLTISITKQRL